VPAARHDEDRHDGAGDQALARRANLAERTAELATIRILVDPDLNVTCAGGGSMLVVPDGHGGLR
jgi:hypothetical protein